MFVVFDVDLHKNRPRSRRLILPCTGPWRMGLGLKFFSDSLPSTDVFASTSIESSFVLNIKENIVRANGLASFNWVRAHAGPFNSLPGPALLRLSPRARSFLDEVQNQREPACPLLPTKKPPPYVIGSHVTPLTSPELPLFDTLSNLLEGSEQVQRFLQPQ
ncbi:hypothetical protein AVEN_254835-1 [Araneus ventricosus]|uniref:RNase H type-1 domain-containing protein n=1 Tax=Araneus ventricosus TaxID=182803 RepID=A0A4Y2IUK4_ARAVE|nr:hypothetical protein AVEN_254835-1 [Araneus ventricosus]